MNLADWFGHLARPRQVWPIERHVPYGVPRRYKWTPDGQRHLAAATFWADQQIPFARLIRLALDAAEAKGWPVTRAAQRRGLELRDRVDDAFYREDPIGVVDAAAQIRFPRPFFLWIHPAWVPNLRVLALPAELPVLPHTRRMGAADIYEVELRRNPFIPVGQIRAQEIHTDTPR